jgi:hypothetical protein
LLRGNSAKNLVVSLPGKLFGDKGYLTQQLAQQLLVTQALQLITKLRKKIHNRLLGWPEHKLSRWRRRRRERR